MKQALVGGLIGAVGSAFVVKRVKELKMFYASSGKYDNVVVAVCVDQLCTVDHVDVNGNMYSNLQLHANDLILGGGYRARIRNHGHSCFLCEIVIRSQFHTTYEPEA
jgi:hypothetical protein